MTGRPVRQGDVALWPVTSIPADAQPVKQRGDQVQVKSGEVTGHHHEVAVADAQLFETANAAERYLRVHRATQLTHPEHGTILVQPGDYRLPPQVEFEDAALPRAVVD